MRLKTFLNLISQNNMKFSSLVKLFAFFCFLSTLIGCENEEHFADVAVVSWRNAAFQPGKFEIPNSSQWINLQEQGYDYSDSEPFLWAKIPFPEHQFVDPAIYLFSEVNSFTVFLDSTQVLHEGFLDFKEHPRFYSHEPYWFMIPKDKKIENIYIRFQKNKALLILDNPKIRIGEKANVIKEAVLDLKHSYRDAVVTQFIGNSLLFLGIGFVFAFMRRHSHMAVLSFGLFSLLAGIFIIFSMDTAVVLSLDLNMVPFIQTFLYYLIFILFLHFCDYMYATNKFNWIRFFWITISIILIPGYWILSYFNLFKWWLDSLPLLSITSLVFSLITILRSDKKVSSKFQTMITVYSVLYMILMINSFLQFFKFFPWTLIPLDWGLFALVIGFALLFSEHYLFTSSQMNTVQKELLEMQKENYRTRLSALKRQLNPHFLFNSLSNLISLIEINPDDAIEFTEELSEVYRYTLESSKTDLATIKSELEYLASYNYLLQTRFKDNYKLLIEVPESYLKHQIPVLSLQILIENIFKHNIVSEKSRINVQIYIENNQLVVVNNIHKKVIDTKSGFGLQNLEKRLAYFTDNTMTIEKNNEHFYVFIPLLDPNKSIVAEKIFER